MTQTITIELEDDIYEVIKVVAEKNGRPIEDVAIEWLARTKSYRPEISEDEKQAALERLKQYKGAVSSSNPRSADNEQIDKDLARAYGSRSEGSE